jgi:hypothetical protein
VGGCNGSPTINTGNTVSLDITVSPISLLNTIFPTRYSPCTKL